MWRVVRIEVHPASLNMAIDEAVSEGIAAGTSPPTIRFYRWKPSAVSIGCFQSIMDEVDVDKCRRLGVDVVRRRTGGGAVYHDFAGEITYSVIAPEGLIPGDITKSYQEICGWIINSLSLLGLGAEFKPINDIIVGGKKISGNAQTRRKGVVLQHGTVLYDSDIRTMFSVLKVGAEKISDKLIKSAEERVTTIKKLKPDILIEDVEKYLIEGFTRGKQFRFGKWSREEATKAEQLAKDKYGSREWNFQR